MSSVHFEVYTLIVLAFHFAISRWQLYDLGLSFTKIHVLCIDANYWQYENKIRLQQQVYGAIEI